MWAPPENQQRRPWAAHPATCNAPAQPRAPPTPTRVLRPSRAPSSSSLPSPSRTHRTLELICLLLAVTLDRSGLGFRQSSRHHGSHLLPHALPLPRAPPTPPPRREITAHARPLPRAPGPTAPPRQIRCRPAPRTRHRRRRGILGVRPPPLAQRPGYRGEGRRADGGLLRRRRRQGQQQQLRPRRGKRRRRRRQREPERRHGRALPEGAAAGAGQPAASAQLRQVPARGGARPGGRRGVLRPRPARLPRRRRPAQPLRPRPLGGRPGQGPRRRLLPARRPGRARRLLCAGIVRELPVGRRGRRGRGSEHGGGLWLPGVGAGLLTLAVVLGSWVARGQLYYTVRMRRAVMAASQRPPPPPWPCELAAGSIQQ